MESSWRVTREPSFRSPYMPRHWATGAGYGHQLEGDGRAILQVTVHAPALGYRCRVWTPAGGVTREPLFRSPLSESPTSMVGGQDIKLQAAAIQSLLWVTGAWTSGGGRRGKRPNFFLLTVICGASGHSCGYPPLPSAFFAAACCPRTQSPWTEIVPPTFSFVLDLFSGYSLSTATNCVLVASMQSESSCTSPCFLFSHCKLHSHEVHSHKCCCPPSFPHS